MFDDTISTMTLDRYYNGFFYNADGSGNAVWRSSYVKNNPMLCLDEMKSLGGHYIIHYVEKGHSYVESIEPTAFEKNLNIYGKRC